MYLKIRKSAHPFIAEGVKNGSFFLSISVCWGSSRHSQKTSNLIKSNYRLVVRLLEKAKISALFEGATASRPLAIVNISTVFEREIASRLAPRKTTQNHAKLGGFSECSTAVELMRGAA